MTTPLYVWKVAFQRLVVAVEPLAKDPARPPKRPGDWWSPEVVWHIASGPYVNSVMHTVEAAAGLNEVSDNEDEGWRERVAAVRVLQVERLMRLDFVPGRLMRLDFVPGAEAPPTALAH